MKFFSKEEKNPQQFTMNGNSGPPLDGPRSALAGVAEPNDRLDVLGYGSFYNAGSKASPRWVRLYAKEPTSAEGEWSEVEGGE